jgi:uncharacterized protein (TIGR03083 family)
MAKADPWPFVHSERKALVADLEGLTEQQWDTPSLCEGWTVRDVVAHMTAEAKLSAGAFFGKLIASGFRFEGVQAKGIAAERGTDGADTLNRFREVLTSLKKPPGPVDTMLGETIVHSEDIRRPLGIAHDYAPEWTTRGADFYRGSNLIIGGKKRAAGLTFRATDADWSAGSGPEVAGPATSILLAISGRRAALDDLSGDGLETLRARM